MAFLCLLSLFLFRMSFKIGKLAILIGLYSVAAAYAGATSVVKTFTQIAAGTTHNI